MMKKNYLFWSLLAVMMICSPTGAVAQSWTASAPSEGTFYLYNVGKEAFVYGANDWDKRASTTQHGGIPITLVSSSGKYLISTAPLYTGKYFGFNSGKSFVYLDKADVYWEFIAVDGLTNTYIMKATSDSSTRYMVADASGTTTSASSSQPTSANGYWQLLTKDQLIAYMTENAAEDNPIDATWAIQNFYFGYEANIGLWQGASEVVGQSEQPYNRCIEKWNTTTFDVYQEITGMPNGVYTLELQGFYRMGNSSNDAAASAAAREAGNEQLNAKYYINDVEAPLKSILDYSHASSNDSKYNTSSAVTVNGVNYYVPNNQQRSAYCFLQGEYWNEPIRVVVTDGTLRVGVKKSQGDANDWAAFDNFRLTYRGPLGIGAAIDAAIATWHDKYDDIVDQAYDRGHYDDILDAANVAAACPDEAALNAYDATVWQAVCDVLQDAGNASVQFDITSLITNPNFDSNANGWTTGDGFRYNSTSSVADFFNASNTSITQVLADMPVGSYTLKAQGFYRSKAWRDAVAAYQHGEDQVKGNIILGNASAPVCNIYDQTRYQPARLEGNAGGSFQKIAPDSRASAKAAFEIGQYWNQVSTTTTADGNLTLGLNIVGGLGDNWFCFDNFRLYYGATAIPVDLKQGLPADDTQATTVNTGITLNAGEYNKVCLPFDLDATQTAAAFKAAYTLAGVTEGGVGQLVPAYSIEAGKAYFVTVDATKTLTVNDVMVKVAQPDSVPVMWEGAATVGTFDGYTFAINYSTGMNATTFEPVDFTNMSFTVNQENWRARRFLSEVNYLQDRSVHTKISAYNVGQPAPLDHPHSVFIPVPQNSSALTVTVSKESNYSDAETFTFNAGTTLCEVPNLIPQSTYYYKVEAGGSVLTQGQFQTEGHLRMIKTITGFNMRDLGGWETIDGNRLRYGKIFRGGELNLGHVVDASDLAEMRRLGMGAELDFRRDGDCFDTTPTSSVLTNDSEHYLYLNQGYGSTSNYYLVDKELYKRAFNFTLDNLRNGRAVYFHCRIGADRTGAYGMLIEGLCGATFDQICKDYELTSYSEADTREWDGSGQNLIEKLDYIESLPGTTLQQKFFYYMNHELEISATDLFDFIDIMVDGESSIRNSDLAFNHNDGEYLQTTAAITAICAAGSTIVNGAKALLSDDGGSTTTEVAMSIDGITVSFADIQLEANKDYMLTIPAESVDKDGTANAAAVTLMFRTPLVMDGDYYLYNEEHEQFLSRNRNYGTRGVLDNFGIPATFTTDKDNITTIKFLDNELYYGDQDGYTDKGTGDAIRWTLEPKTNGAFLLFLNDGVNKYVTMNYDNTYKYYFNRLRETTHSDYIETPFVVKTAAEQKAIVAAKKEANILTAATAAGITATNLSEFEAALAGYTAAPSPAVIKSADSGNTSDWVLSEPWARNESGNGYNVGNYGAEFYLKNASVSQTVTVPRAGLYKLTLNAFLREGTNERCFAAGEKGFVLSNAYVSINDTYYAQVPDWYSDRRTETSPNSTDRAKELMDAGKYAMEVYAYIGEAKKATITLTVPGYSPSQWFIFNHFALTEYVPNVTLSETADAAPEACDYAYVTLQRTIVAKTNVESGNAWNTICFPFALNSDQIAETFGTGTVVKELSDVNITGENASLTFETVTAIEANKPYIMQVETGGDEYTINGVAITPSTDLTVEKGDLQFIGNYVYPCVMANDGGTDYYILNDLFKSSTGSTMIKGYRAYFHVTDANIKSLGFDEGEATGMELVESGELRDECEIYDLAGRKLSTLNTQPSTLPKGLYIINGKKVFVK